jgi:hypothetical protein
LPMLLAKLVRHPSGCHGSRSRCHKGRRTWQLCSRWQPPGRAERVARFRGQRNTADSSSHQAPLARTPCTYSATLRSQAGQIRLVHLVLAKRPIGGFGTRRVLRTLVPSRGNGLRRRLPGGRCDGAGVRHACPSAEQARGRMGEAVSGGSPRTKPALPRPPSVLAPDAARCPTRGSSTIAGCATTSGNRSKAARTAAAILATPRVGNLASRG